MANSKAHIKPLIYKANMEVQTQNENKMFRKTAEKKAMALIKTKTLKCQVEDSEVVIVFLIIT